jgi:hypothetical protein
MLFSEPVSSGKGFDKRAKKIIRSHYKLISDKSSEALQKEMIDSSQSERKDYSSRTAFSALTADNASTNESDQIRAQDKPGTAAMQQVNSKKIVNYYNGGAQEHFEQGRLLFNY